MLESDCDKAFDRFRELNKQVWYNLSESDTRAKILDPLFKEVLGWDEKEITRETHIHSGYLDYIFKTGVTRWFVLEAKSVEKSFEIPLSHTGRRYRLNGSISTHKTIKDSIDQTQQYCINSGARYGVVSNGTQFILFEAFKYDDDWHNGDCIVFHSLEDIQKNFVLFWNILNRNSVINEGSLRRYISREDIRLAYLYRPIDRLHVKSHPLTRNNMSPLVQPFNNFVFTDIIEETQLDVLKSCYVVGAPYKAAGLELRRHFDRPPKFAEKYSVETIIESSDYAGKFEELYTEFEKILRTEAPKGSLVILMGGIGCGKTTFIHHFFNFVIKKPAKTLWFYVNFINAPTDPKEIESYVIKTIVDEFEKKYYSKLREELKTVGLDVISYDMKSVTILLSMLTLKGYTLSLVFDNVDQHSYISPEYQEQAFLVAKRLTESLKMITILTLREESFFKSTMSGVLDSFPPPVFHISSPSFEELIRQRINYVLGLLEKSVVEISEVLGAEIRTEAEREILKIFFGIIKNSLRSNRKMGREILRFIDEVSGGDMRTALRFFRLFLVSGNTDVEDMLTKDKKDRDKGYAGYLIPFHHVIRSIILLQSRLYSNSTSEILNLFNFNPDFGDSHFLNLRILNYLYNRLSNEPPQGRGFVAIDGLLREALRLGINSSAIAYSMETMAEKGLVQFENQSKKGYKEANYVRITNTGMYYIDELVKNFQYIDLVWMDTPITDKRVVERLLELVIELGDIKTIDDLYDRFERTEIFLEYLRQAEEAEMKNYPEYRESDFANKEFMPEIIVAYNEQKNYIEESRKQRQLRYGALEK